MNEMGALLTARRLRGCEHVIGRDETEILGKAQFIEVPGRRPPGRLTQTWKQNMQLTRGASAGQISLPDHNLPHHLMKK